MSGAEFGGFTVSLLLLLAAAHLCGWLSTRLRQPRVVGEMFAGVLLGPALLGRLWPSLSTEIFRAGDTSAVGLRHQAVIGFLFNLGLVLLMFAAGAETKGLFRRDDAKATAWLGLVGTGLPFVVALAAAPWLPVPSLIGTANHQLALLLVLAISVAVTSIPVISKIFHDLGVSHTRFARLVLAVAVLEDIGLWGVLAVATALAGSAALPQGEIARHVIVTVTYFALGLTLVPYAIHRVTHAPWNVLARTSPVAYIVTVLLAYTAIGAMLDVNLVFAAFLAGYALMAEPLLDEATATLSRVSFAVFIPVYFAVVGYRLDLTYGLSVGMLVAFLVLTSAIKLFSAGLGARLAGFPWLDAVNLSVALNARGGPGIVVATVAYDTGVINATFYTTLVLVAVVTSQAAGAWLDFVLRRGWPLLSGDEVPVASVVTEGVRV